MACHHPIPAYLARKGGVTFLRKEAAVGRTGLLTLKCGMCVGCKADHARDWAIRCYHEAQLHDRACFVTLTYEDTYLPAHGSLSPNDLRLFFMGMRNRGHKFRYFACGEYGAKRNRPHYHVCFFGYQPTERKLIGKSDNNNPQYFDQDIYDAWKRRGRATWSDFDASCARYTAHYTAGKLKSYAKEQIDEETGLRPYERIDVNTGEVVALCPEFQRQSLKPGIGMPWLEKYWREVFPTDTVTMDGKEYPPPRAYWKWLKEHHPEVAAKVEKKRRDAIAEIPYEPATRIIQKNQARARSLAKFERHNQEIYK